MRRDAVTTNTRSWRTSFASVLALGVGAAFGAPAEAFELDTGNPELRIRFDNTVKYSTAFRVKDQSDALTAPVNEDDGDRNFDRGLISNRLDLLSEFDVTYRDFGVRVSGAAWYDTVYNRSNDNSSPGTVNQTSVGHDRFTDATRELHGRDVELLDAFAFGKVDLDESTVSFRAGRHSLQWGESLFFGANGIAGGMAPVDIVKALSVPNTQFKELIRPVPQLSGQYQINANVSIGAYYQLGWEKNRFPGAGSYFATTDTFDEGAETLRYFGPFAARKASDVEARDSGQGGVQVRFRLEDTDFGVYAIRYHDKSPQLYFRNFVSGTPRGVNLPGQYYYVYPEDIRAFGASFSHTIGIVNLAGEASFRDNMPLASSGQFNATGTGDNDENPLYAVGRTAHAQVSWLASLPPNMLAEESSFVGEIAWNRVLSVTKNRAAFNPNADRDAVSIRMVFEPSYRQVLSGLDISVPIGVGFGIGNSGAVGTAVNGQHVGDISIGVNGTYENAWRLGLSYTHYFGPEGAYLDSNNNPSFKQALKDRDFIALTASRTF